MIVCGQGFLARATCCGPKCCHSIFNATEEISLRCQNDELQVQFLHFLWQTNLCRWILVPYLSPYLVSARDPISIIAIFCRPIMPLSSVCSLLALVHAGFLEAHLHNVWSHFKHQAGSLVRFGSSNVICRGSVWMLAHARAH